MRVCENCGTENNEDAKFCKQCGSPFPQGEKSGSDASDDPEPIAAELDSAPSAKESPSTGSSPSPSESATHVDADNSDIEGTEYTGNNRSAQSGEATSDLAIPESQSETVEDGGDTAKTAAKENTGIASESPLQKNDASDSKRPDLRERWDGLAKGKRYAILGVLAAVLVLVIVIVATVTAGPSASQIESEFRQGVNLEMDDTWSDSGDYKIDSVKITGKDKTDVDNFLYKGELWHVTVEANLSNETASIDGTWSADYIKNGNDWASLSGFSVDSISYNPSSGVDEDKVLARASSIFDPYGFSSGKSTASNVSYSISAHQTNGTQDTLTLTKTEETDFSTVTTTASCVFTFNGSWKYNSSKSKVNSPVTDLSKLIGTWQGKFYDMSSVTLSDDGECKGGVKNPAVLKIDSIDADGTVKGTVSVLAHIHPKVKSDVESTDGDQMVDIPFTSHLSSNFGQTENSGQIVVSTTKDDDQISVSIGTVEDNGEMQMMATVANTYSYKNEYNVRAFLYYKEVYEFTKQ